MEDENISTVFYDIDTNIVLATCDGTQGLSFFGESAEGKDYIYVDKKVIDMVKINKSKIINGKIVQPNQEE